MISLDRWICDKVLCRAVLKVENNVGIPSFTGCTCTWWMMHFVDYYREFNIEGKQWKKEKFVGPKGIFLKQIGAGVCWKCI